LNRADDKDRIIDADGFRPNVGIVVCNADGQVLWGRRINGRDSWQFPQGGIHPGENAEAAMYRELDEEVGLKPEHVRIMSRTKGWHRYRLPSRYVRRHEKPVCIGQKQKWFLLRLEAGDDAVRLDAHDSPEFDDWRWVSYWYPLTAVVDFKRDVYRSAMTELVEGFAPRRKRRRR
jgi:putative (di)nucleoside polyphosphate hydrolase